MQLLDLDGTVIEVDEPALVAAGFDPSDVVGRPYWETWWWSHDTDAQGLLKDAVARAARGERVRVDAVITTLDGSLITIDFQLHPVRENEQLVGLVPSGIDVTDRRAATRRLGALGDFAQALALADTTPAVAQAVVEHLPGALDATFASLASVDTELRLVTFIQPPTLPADLAERYVTSPLSAHTPLTDAIRDRRTIVIADLNECQRRYPQLLDDTLAAGLNATASVPLVADLRAMGAVGVGWSDPLDDEDDAIGSRLQVVAELTAQTLRRCHVADDRAQLIEQLRRHLLPSQLEFSGLDIAVRYQPAGDSIGFGGDWYDLIPLPDGTVAMVVGDIAGHGITAAARMGVLRTALNAVIRLGTPLGEVFDVTEPLIAELGHGFLGSAVVAVIDTTHQRVTYTSAGHPPLLFAEPGCRTRALEGGVRPILGLGAHRPASTGAPLPHGFVLLAYTDGLVESRREHLDIGIARVANALDGLTGTAATSEHIADIVLQTAGDPRDLRDDVALVVVRVAPAPGAGFGTGASR